MKLGDAFYEIIGDSSGLGKDFDRADKTAQRGADKIGGGIKQKLGGVFSVMGGMLGAQVVGKAASAVKNFMSEAIGSGSDAEEMLSKFAVTFGGMTDSTMAELDAFAAATGRSRYTLQGMAADFGAVLKGMHLSEDATSALSTSMAMLAVDWGSFANQDATEVMAKFRSALTGEYESMKSLGIVINAAAVEQELLNMGIEGGAKAATQAQLVQARSNLIMAASGDAMGDAARTADSWANQQVKLGAIWNDFQTDLGRGLTGALGPLQKMFVGLAGRVLPKVAEAITGKLIPGFVGLIEKGKGLADAFSVGWAEGGPAGVALNVIGELLGHPLPDSWIETIWNVQGAIQGLFDAVSGGGLAGGAGFILDALGISPEKQTQITTQLEGIIEGVKGTLASLFSGDLMGAAGGLLNVAGLISGLRDRLLEALPGLATSILEALKGAFPDLAPLIDGVLQPLVDGGGKVLSAFLEIKSTLSGVIGELVSNIAGQLGERLPEILGGVGEVVQVVTTNLPQVLAIVQNVFGDVAPFISRVLGDAVSFVLDTFGGLVTWFQANLPLIQATVETVLGAIQVVWDTVWPYMQSVLEWYWEYVKTLTSTAINAILGIIKTVMLLIQGDWEGAWNEIQGVAETVWSGITTIITNTMDTILGFFGTSVADMVQAGRDLMDGFRRGAEEAWEEVKETIKGFVDWLPQWVKDRLGIQSPSTVFLEIGLNMMEGLSEGIDEGQAKVMKNLAKTVKELVTAFGRLLGINAAAASNSNVTAILANLESTVLQMMATIERIIATVGYDRIHKLKLTARRLREILESVLVDLSGIKDYDMSGLPQWAEDVENVLNHVLQIMERTRAKYGDKLLEVFSILAGYLSQVFSLAQSIDFEAMQPLEGENWADRLILWAQQAEFGGSLLVDWLNRIPQTWQLILAKLAELAGYVSQIYGIASQIDLSKMLPLDAGNWRALLRKWMRQVEFAGSLLVDWLNRIPQTWRDILAGFGDLLTHVRSVFELAQALDLSAMVPLDASNWRQLMDRWMKQVEYGGSIVVGWLHRIPAKWREILAGFGDLNTQVGQVGSLTSAFDLSSMVPTEQTGWRGKMHRWMRQVEFAGSLLAQYLDRIPAKWREALKELGPLSDLVQQVFGLLQINLEFKVGGASFLPRLKTFIADLKAGAPILQKGIQDIAGMWDSVEALAADVDLSSKIQEVFGILNLASTIEGLVRRQTLGEDEYYTALSNVVMQLIEDLKSAAPLLKEGLKEVAALFGDALQSTIDISASIGEMFSNLGNAVSSIASMTEADWSLADLLNVLNDLQAASNAAASLTVTSEPGDYTDWFAQLKETIKSAITEAFEFVNWRLDIHFFQDQRERAQWAMLFNRQQSEIESIRMQLSALAQG